VKLPNQNTLSKRDPYISSANLKTQGAKIENQPFSKTGVNRVVFGAKVDGGLLREFREAVRRNGHSYCYLVEGWMRAYVEASKVVFQIQNLQVNQSFTVVQNLHFDRYVYKPRRVYRRRNEEESFVRVEEIGSYQKCGSCDLKPEFITYYWGEGQCLRSFLCLEHFERAKKAGAVHGFRVVGV